ncbi:MAG TPA: cadherin-like domain-containing protein [Rhodocyclaceae bacterium]|nr:cadherin-like domain-containing protein [Rhodocyclaceae bacterium]
MPSKRCRLRPLIEELEPRLLFSADLAPVVVDVLHPAPEQRVLNADGEFTNLATATRNELVIVDASVADYKALLADILGQAGDGRHFDVVVLDPGRDGIDQISQALAQRGNLDALHLITHGESGSLQFGTSRLDAASLKDRTAEIAAWGVAFNAHADLLLYGCDVATGAEGKVFVDSLSRLTGADVAASTDNTGNPALGGNWVLEYHAGAIETASAVDANRPESWRGLLGNEFLVNTTPNNDQTTDALTRGSQQAVAYDAAGNYVVVWTSKSQDNSGTDGVYARRFSADGTPLTAEILVNGTTAGNQNGARVVSDAAGNFIVTWSGEGTGDTDGVFWRRFAADGTPLTAETRANISTAGTQINSTIAMNPATGAFVVAWEGQGTSDTYGIWFRRYDANGNVLDPTDQRANLTDTGTEANPAVAMDSTGRFVIAFEVGNHMYFQRFDAGGVALGSRTQADNGLSHSTGAAIAMDGAGNFTLVYRETTTLSGIWGRGFNADGSQRYSWFYADSGDATSPSIAMASDGAFVVTYQKTGTSGIDIFARKYNANGTPNGSPFTVNQSTSNDQTSASVALRDMDDFVVVWSGWSSGDSKGVYARTYNQFMVTTTADVVDGNTASIEALIANQGADGKISLREAITAANNTAGHDTIVLPSGTYTITLSGAGENANAYGDFDVIGDLTILGAGSGSTVISGNTIDAVMQIISGSVAIADVTIRDGYTFGTGVGAGIEVDNGASLSLSRSVVRNNTSAILAGGGGIANAGSLSLTDVEIRDNAAAGYGGGIYNTGTALALDRVTLAGNTASYGGGLYGAGSSQTLTNVTVSGNSVGAGYGGGLYFTQAATLESVTIANNNAAVGGGVYSNGATVTLRNVLLANNGGGSLGGSGIVSLGNNLADDSPTQLGQATDKVGGVIGLAALADNGGYTRTHALGGSSWAIDAGNSATAPATDQRGAPRVGAADIGAYESAGAVANHAPTVANPMADQTATQDAAFSYIFAANTFNDVDVGDTLGYTVTGAPSWLTFNAASRTFTGTPANADVGAATITVRATDGSGAWIEDQFVLTVANVNDAPVITSNGSGTTASVSVAENTTAVTTVTATDIDLPAQTLTYSIAGGADAAQFNINAATGALTFITAPNYEVPTDAGANNVYEVSVQVSDGSLTDSQAIAVSVTNVNEAPTANADAYALSQNTTLSVVAGSGLLANDSDPENNSLTAALVTGPAHGSLTLNANGSLTYTPTVGYTGSDAFSYKANDGSLDSNTATVALTVNVVNYAPTTTLVLLTPITEDSGPRLITQAQLLANVSDANGDPLTATSLAISAGAGTLVNNGNGTWTYTPVANDDAGVSFSYTVTDGSLTAAGTATLDITPVNDTPTVANVMPDQAATQGAAFSYQFAASTFNDVDVGDTLTYSVSGVPSWLTFNAASRTFAGTPANADVGAATITVRATDGSGAWVEDQFMLTVANVNDAPTVVAINLGSINEDGSRLITQADLLAGAGDVDGNPLTAVELTLTAGSGVLTSNSDGTWTFAPAANWNGAASFAFGVADGTATTANTASLTVMPVNDAPTTSPVTLAAIAADSGGRLITQAELLANANDVDGPALTASGLAIASGKGTLADNGNGTWTYTPAANDDTGVSFSYTVTDGSLTAAGTATLNITPPVIDVASVVVVESPAGKGPSPSAADKREPVADKVAAVLSESPIIGARASSNSQDGAADLSGDRQVLFTPVHFVATIPNAFGSDIHRTTNPPESPPLLYAFNNAVDDKRAAEMLQTSLGSQQFQQQLDQVQDKIRQQLSLDKAMVASTLAVSTGLSVGYVLWLIRGGVLLSSLLSSLPAWRLIDPLPILGHLNRRKDAGAEDDSLEGMLKKAADKPKLPPQPTDGQDA